MSENREDNQVVQKTIKVNEGGEVMRQSQMIDTVVIVYENNQEIERTESRNDRHRVESAAFYGVEDNFNEELV